MKKSENPFRIIYNRAHNYFAYSIARRVFFFSGIAVLLCALLAHFDDSVWALYALLTAAIVCAAATLVDSVQCRRAFVRQLKSLEADFLKRTYEKKGDEGLGTTKGAFSQEELTFMRKKKREFNYSIVVKAFFIILFVVLMVNLL
jgi:hypothetical protein